MNECAIIIEEWNNKQTATMNLANELRFISFQPFADYRSNLTIVHMYDIFHNNM